MQYLWFTEYGECKELIECLFCHKNEKTECMCAIDCDENCQALVNPRTFYDYKKTYEHWTNHTWQLGCSHGD